MEEQHPSETVNIFSGSPYSIERDILGCMKSLYVIAMHIFFISAEENNGFSHLS